MCNQKKERYGGMEEMKWASELVPTGSIKSGSSLCQAWLSRFESVSTRAHQSSGGYPMQESQELGPIHSILVENVLAHSHFPHDRDTDAYSHVPFHTHLSRTSPLSPS